VEVDRDAQNAQSPLWKGSGRNASEIRGSIARRRAPLSTRSETSRGADIARRLESREGSAPREQDAYYAPLLANMRRARHRRCGWRGARPALDAFCPSGEVLELACGPGGWRSKILRYRANVTAVGFTGDDRRARERCWRRGGCVAFQAELFTVEGPTGATDVVVFGFGSPTCPIDRFEGFWR
jgi:hypothetical protein